MPEKTQYAHGEFSWVDFVSHDMPSACAFYEAVFDWESVRQDTQGGPPYAIFQKGGQAVAGIGQMDDAMKSQGLPPMWNSYVNVDDVNAAVQKATELGGTVAIPPMKVLEAGWLAFLQDPTGGNLGLWQKERHIGAQLVNEPGAFCWNELATGDSERAKEFYAQLFGWEYDLNNDAPTTYYIIRHNGSDNGGIMQMTDEWGQLPPLWTVYFSTDDVDATGRRVHQNGGEVSVPPFETPAGKVGVMKDPQGGMFNIAHLSQAGC